MELSHIRCDGPDTSLVQSMLSISGLNMDISGLGKILKNLAGQSRIGVLVVGFSRIVALKKTYPLIPTCG